MLNSRLHRICGSWLLGRVRSKWRCIDPLLRPFIPEAVVTVTHGYSWIAAAEYALRNKLPLHLVLHDDWPGQQLVLGPLRSCAHRLLAYYYRHAASRLCISPVMAEVYQRECSAPASVLYPCSEPGSFPFSNPPARLSHNSAYPVIGFGGTISGTGQARAVRTLAKALENRGGKLRIYGPLSHERRASLSLDLPNIELKGLVSSAAMLRAFRESVDALLLPLSFLERDRRQTIMSFPSKLADYTATGLPLLILAPEYSSLVQWAKSTGDITEIVTVADEATVQAAIERLAAWPEHRLRLGARTLAVHQKYFTHANAWATFRAALQSAQSVRN